jgi:hypothetical protein
MLKEGIINYRDSGNNYDGELRWVLSTRDTTDSDVNWFSGIKAGYSCPIICELCEKELPVGKCMYTDNGMPRKGFIFFCSKQCYKIFKLKE